MVRCSCAEGYNARITKSEIVKSRRVELVEIDKEIERKLLDRIKFKTKKQLQKRHYSPLTTKR
jgi:hypothetical protein